MRDGKPISIHRILGVDEKGILYIGATKIEKVWEKDLEIYRLVYKWLVGKWKGKDIFILLAPSLMYTGLFNVIKNDELWIYFKEFSKEDVEYQERG